MEAVLLDTDDTPVHLPIIYNAFASSSSTIEPSAATSVTSGIITITKEFINNAGNDLEATTDKFSHLSKSVVGFFPALFWEKFLAYLQMK